jgi:hypothetical protein
VKTDHPVKLETGMVREDGFVLVEFKKENGRLYPMWRSRESIERRREYQQAYWLRRKESQRTRR